MRSNACLPALQRDKVKSELEQLQMRLDSAGRDRQKALEKLQVV